jgi:outer membrane lipoprotein-sorting protein
MRKLWQGSFVVCLLLAAAHPGRADNQDEVKTIIDKAIKAAGGEAKLTKLQAVSMKAKVTAQDGNQEMTINMEGSLLAFDKARIDMEMTRDGMVHKALVVINGDKGWAKHDNKVEEAPQDILEAIRQVMYSLRLTQRLVPLKDKTFKLSALGESKIGDHAAVGVQVAHKDYKDLNLYFDKETGLPAKLQMQIKEPGGQDVSYEFTFGDYKEIDGLKHFTKITFTRDGKKFMEAELSDIKPQEKLEDNLFAKPE